MYSINGDLLGCAKFGDDPMKPASSSISSSPCPSPSPSLASASRDCLSDATDNQSKMKKEGSHINLSSLSWSRVVLAPPCPGWQDGIVAVTGHDNGLVCFWRLQTIQTVDCKILSRELVPSPLYLSAAQSAAQLPSQFQTAGQVQKRIQTHPYTHNAPIIVLKLSPIMSAKSKDLTEKNIQSGPLDLLVGDEKGYVSAWTLMKLDQFSPVELSLMTCLKPPPPRDTHAPSSTTGSTSTLVGAANSFVPLGAASGLLKLLGAGVMASTSGIHTNQTQRHHETASALAARIQEIEDLSNDDHMEEFF